VPLQRRSGTAGSAGFHQCRGDRHEQGLGSDGKDLNPFQWDRIYLNLPGLKDYEPTKSWISKIRVDGRVACDLFTFVDNEQVTGPDKDLTWQASHALASKQSYLGIQDARQKARLSSKMPGAWPGVIVHVLSMLGVCVLTSTEKWIKMKGILEKWWYIISGPTTPKLLHKELLSDHGFLVYITRTYPAMIPYLKGFHLTIKMWRGGHDLEGWKLQDDSSVKSSALLSSLDATRARGHGLDLSLAASYSADQAEDNDVAGVNHWLRTRLGEGQVYAPGDGLTNPVPRFKDDIAALRQLTAFEILPLRAVRPSQVVQVETRLASNSAPPYPRITIASVKLERVPWALVESGTALACGLQRRRGRAQTLKSSKTW
jgi:hypothetical protein